MSIFTSDKKTKRCPFMSGKPCMQHECMLYQPIIVVDKSKTPSQPFERFDCTFNNQNIHGQSLGQAAHETGAAIESLRNEVIKESRIARQETQQQHRERLQQTASLDHNGRTILEYRA